jgi:hypothetical protein
MIDAKQTLVNLHSKFPSMSLDDLFTILDCYVEQFGLTTWQTPNFQSTITCAK